MSKNRKLSKKPDKYDFSGWATKANVKCTDGRVISHDAFKENSGCKVPLVWMHSHDNPENVLGYAYLEHRDGEGTYAYCVFNGTKKAVTAQALVEHGDVESLSIHANKLKSNGKTVMHGDIKEVSLVLAGANPGAHIENVCFSHGELVDSDDEANIYNDELIHYDDDYEEDTDDEDEDEEIEHEDKSIGAVLAGMSDEQRNACYALLADMLDQSIEHSEGGEDMKKNLFDEGKKNEEDETLSHSDFMDIVSDAQKGSGSLRKAFLEHGITNIGYLLPEATKIRNTPDLITRDMGWVSKVLSGIHKSPFARIRSQAANLTPDEARAKGYVTGAQKQEETFALLQRETYPTTIYKKQKLDRDNIVDITDMNVVAWLKEEMKMMLDEERARAYLIGDGRASTSADKIKEDCIRPIWTDHDTYAVHKSVTDVAANDTAEAKAKKIIKAIKKNRKFYKGSGKPSLFVGTDLLTDMMLIEDANGRIIYESEESLCRALRVKEIIEVPQMDGLTRTTTAATLNNFDLHAIMVNLSDYTTGADKGGNVAMFDDFDIDYNQYKYLIETRCSGCLTLPSSALIIESAGYTAADA